MRKCLAILLFLSPVPTILAQDHGSDCAIREKIGAHRGVNVFAGGVGSGE